MTTNDKISFEGDFRNEQPVALPNATVVLVLGILSIPLCCCYGILGLILSIIALVMASNANKLYTESPARYTESSYKNVSTGKICAIVGLVLSLITIISFIVTIAKFGWGIFSDPSVIYEYYGIPYPY
jgi:uncharacterized protein YacL